jgi:hypothetical protein
MYLDTWVLGCGTPGRVEQRGQLVKMITRAVVEALTYI